MVAAHEPRGHEPRHVDRVLRRAELWRVAEFHLFEVEDGHACLDGDGDHIDPLVHTVPADGLRPEQPACVGGEEQLERHLLRAGVVAGVVGRMDVDFPIGQIRPHEDFFRRAGDRRDAIEHAHDRRGLSAPIAGYGPRVAAEDRRGRDSALAVGRTGERHLRRSPGHEVANLHRVADGPDRRITRLHRFADADAATLADIEPGVDGECVLGPHAHAEDHEVGRERFSRLELHRHPAAGRHEAVGRVAEDHPHASRRECLDERHGHLRIERRQHLRLQFDHHRLHAQFDEILGQFEADEAGADHDHSLRGSVHPGLDTVDIVEVAEREHVRQVDARNRRPQWSGTRGEDQRVVGLVILAARVEILHSHRFALPVDRLHARPRADVESEPLPQQLRLGHEELVTRGDLAADVVGQAAIGKRHVGPAFEHHDLRILGEPPRPCRRRCPSCYATDDYQLHRISPFTGVPRHREAMCVRG